MSIKNFLGKYKPSEDLDKTMNYAFAIIPMALVVVAVLLAFIYAAITGSL